MIRTRTRTISDQIRASRHYNLVDLFFAVKNGVLNLQGCKEIFYCIGLRPHILTCNKSNEIFRYTQKIYLNNYNIAPISHLQYRIIYRIIMVRNKQ